VEYQEVFKKLDQLTGVLIFCGDEAYVRASAIDALRRHLLPEGLESMNETVFDGPVDFDRFVESCETLPFMAEKRLVYWKNCPLIASSTPAKADDKRSMQLFQEYLHEPSPDTVILLETQGKADGRTQIVKEISRLDKLVDFTYLSNVQLEKWAAQYARKAGKRIESQCVQLLSQMVGPALTGIVTELDKAIAYVGSREMITSEDVRTVTTPSLEFRGYQIGDFMLRGERANALESVKTLLFQGTDAIALLAAIASTFRQLLLVKSLLSGGASAAQIGQKLEIRHSFVVNKNISNARGLSVFALKTALEACVDADYQIKSGQLAPEKALYIAIFQAMSALESGKGAAK